MQALCDHDDELDACLWVVNGKACNQEHMSRRHVPLWDWTRYLLIIWTPFWVQKRTQLGGTDLRCVGVLQFVFNILQLLSIRFTQRNLCCFSKSMMKHMQKLDWKWDQPRFSYDFGIHLHA